MSGGPGCCCVPKSRVGWYILNYRCNYSAFSGYHYTSSNYSQIKCTVCERIWRTKAAYVESLPHVPDDMSGVPIEKRLLEEPT